MQHLRNISDFFKNKGVICWKLCDILVDAADREGTIVVMDAVIHKIYYGLVLMPVCVESHRNEVECGNLDFEMICENHKFDRSSPGVV